MRSTFFSLYSCAFIDAYPVGVIGNLSLMAAATIRTAAQHFVQPAACSESQFALFVPSVVHCSWLPPLPTVGHAGVRQAPLAQDRSHWHADAQSTASQAPLPKHVIVHREPL